MSVVEYVRYRIPAEQAEAFVAAWKAARPLAASVPGQEAMELRRGVEDPTDFFARVTWTSLDDHLRFRDSAVFPTFKSHFVGFTIESMSHYEVVDLDSSRPT